MKRILSFILLLGAVHLTVAASPAQSVTDNAPAKVIANTPATGVDNVPITDTDNTPARGVEKAVEYGIVRLSVCNMRRTPDFDAEMVSQALLGTPVHILRTDEGSGWPEIQSPDTYTGWVHKAGIQRMTWEEYTAWNAAEKVVVTALTGTVAAAPSRRAATVSDVVAGDRLRYIGSAGRFWKVGFPDGREGYLRKCLGERESVWRKQLDQSAEAILKTALSMNGFPYLWAGMSPKGMDCSGFVRATLAIHDIIIPRDASQQAPKGERIELFPAPAAGTTAGTAAGTTTDKATSTAPGTAADNATAAAAGTTTAGAPLLPDCSRLLPGDLLFFGRRGANGAKDRVSHVAFYLGDRMFIHSLGLVCIASMDPDSPIYDAYNTGRLLFACRILPWIDRQEGLNTTATNPYYNE